MKGVTCPSCHTENDSSAATCARCGADLGDVSAFIVVASLTPGVIFHGRYEILERLGRGGMGMVYKARDTSLDEIVAIKILHPDFARDRVMAERFRSEIKLARKIRHRNVCAIHDYGEDRGLLYISMELVEGTDLKRILKTRGPLPPEEAYDIAIQVAEGLQAAHDVGVIHRDLKTSNIMYDKQGKACLMDFGIAKREGEGTLTATGMILGTPEYMSPEQAQGQRIDTRSDIYALGIVVYESFTGQVPFRGETPISTILKQIQEPPPFDGQRARLLPAQLRPVLRKALAKKPSHRHATAREFANALKQARSPSVKQQPLDTQALKSPTLRASEATTRFMTRRSSRAAVVGAVVAAAAFMAATAILIVSRSGKAPTTNSLMDSHETKPEPTVTPAETAIVGATMMPGEILPSPGIAPSHSAKPASRQKPRPSLVDRASRRSSDQRRASDARSSATPQTKRPVSRPTAMLRRSPTATPLIVGMGYLQVVVRPWATIYVDGREVGQTPMEAIRLSAGAHTVRIRNPLWKPIERRVTIQSGETEKIRIDLPKEGIRMP